MNVLSYIILILMGASFVSIFGNLRRKWPFLTIVNRWMRWLLFSFLITYLVRKWELSERPFFVLIITFFLGWFLVESILIWFNIRALNRSSISLFPRFTINPVDIKWPNLKQFIQLKEFLRSHGFKEEQSIKTTLVGSLALYSVLYKDSTEKIFLQLLFFPKKNGFSNVYYILTSLSSDGERYITDNIDLPFGGHAPKDWFKIRKPLCDSLENLFECHLKRINASKKGFVSWDSMLLNEVNHQQSILEYYNIQKGFLNPPNLHDDYGKLTSEGCYRLWKQFLFLKYIGISLD